MSTEAKPKKSTEATPGTVSEVKSPVLKLRCKILVNGFKAAGGVAAAGKILTLNLTQEQVEFHEGRKEIKVVGTL